MLRTTIRSWTTSLVVTHNNTSCLSRLLPSSSSVSLFSTMPHDPPTTRSHGDKEGNRTVEAAVKKVTVTSVSSSSKTLKIDACGDVEVSDVEDLETDLGGGSPTYYHPLHAPTQEEEDEMEEMFVQGPAGMEWGGPTRGGRHKEPTRYGDWERKGRCTDFE